jgi:hypothetical protein
MRHLRQCTGCGEFERDMAGTPKQRLVRWVFLLGRSTRGRARAWEVGDNEEPWGLDRT